MRDLERDLIGGNSISEKITSPQNVQFISLHILIYLFEKLISDLVLGIGQIHEFAQRALIRYQRVSLDVQGGQRCTHNLVEELSSIRNEHGTQKTGL